MSHPRLLAFSGSLRRASFNHALVEVAAAGAREAGAEVEVLRLSDYPMPLFDEDLEAASGMPDEARAFKAKLTGADGYLIASPEYNSGYTAALKNAIDWATRTESADEPALLAFRGKVAGLLAASPGALGALRGLPTIRMVLTNLHVLVAPEQFALGQAGEAFAEDGSLVEPRADQSAKGVGRCVARLARQIQDRT